MSNYTITTDFGAKDSLPSSNSAKVVRGSEFTTEFTNIQTAIATKADTAGDTFTGVVNFSADVAVNTNTLFVDVSEAKVGIGTSSPAKPLHVNSGTTNVVARFESTDADARIELKDSASTSLNQISVSGDDLYFSTSATERIRIDSSGNVGIGTTTPTEKLHIVGGDLGIGSTQYRENNVVSYASADYSIATSGAYNLTLKTNDTERMRIDSSGDMTLGTTGKNSATTLTVTNNDGYASTLLLNQHQSGAASIAVPASENALQFNRFNGTSLEEAMRIDSSGNVGIGTTSPATKLHIENGASANNIIQVYGGTSLYAGIGVDGNGAVFTAGSSGSLNAPMIFRTASNGTEAERMRLSQSGNLLVGTTADVTSTNAGVQLRADNTMRIAKTDGAAQSLYRLNSDGNIINFYKDGSNVGNIGSVSGDIRIGGSDNNHAGVRFAASTKAVIPVKNTDGDLSDNTTDLGASNSRFKDLHLSGTGYSDSLLVGTTGATANAKLKVNGAVILNANTIYSKSYATLDTTGDVVAKATGGANGSSITFIFTGQGGTGAPFHIVFSCINAGGQWSATRSEIAASASVDVVASTSGNDVIFTFKSKSGSQGYSPRVRIETIGNTYDATYLAA